MRILTAVDGSKYTKRMLAYLGAHDEWLGPQHQYTVLHAVAALPARATSMIDRDTVKTYYDDSAEKVLKPIRSFFTRHGLDATYVIKVGSASQVIIDTVKRGRHDLIVMGSRGHGSLGSLVMGSVAMKVLGGCETPVLLIR